MPLDIFITNTNGNGGGNQGQANANGTTGGNTATAATRDSAVKQTMTSVYVHRTLSLAANTGKTIARYAVSQYGDMTGDYMGQRKIDYAIGVAETVISIGSSTIMGGMSGGIPGAVFGFIASTASVGVSAYTASKEYEKNVTRANNLANYNAQRIGSVLVNGNRG